MRRALLLLILVSGCKESGGLAAGQPCTASSECAAGLVCDLNAVPPVCADMLSPGMPDADLTAPDAPLGTPDATPAPDSPPGTPDAAPVPDAAPAMPDASPIDAAVIDADLPDA